MVIVPTMRGNGNCGCSCGNLPHTVTVSLSGVAETDVQTAAPTFSITSCIGSGAVAVATAASGSGCRLADTTITELTVTDGGCGYAVLGRKEPVLVASATGGRGITFGTVTLQPATPKDCGQRALEYASELPYWTVSNIEITLDDPTGWAETDKVTIRPQSETLWTVRSVGEAVYYANAPEPIDHLTASLTFTRESPALTASVRPYGNGRNGFGAQLSPQVTPSGGSSWGVSSVTVNDGGDGYITGQVVEFVLGQDTSGSGGAGVVSANDTPPTKRFGITERTTNPRASGANLQLGWRQAVPEDVEFDYPGDGLRYWLATSASVVSGGSKYTAGDRIIYRHESGSLVRVVIDSVDASGAIQSASVNYAWPMLGEGGPIQSVSVTDAGSYSRLRVTGIGAIDATPIYQEDETLPALVLPTAISPDCTHTATIDQTVGSPTFGHVTAVTVEGQEAWRQRACAGRADALGGPHVLRATNPKRLVTVDVSSCWGASTRACIDLRTTRRVAPEFPDDVLIPPGEGCTPATIDYTLDEHEDENGDPYWSIASVTASGGYGYGAARVWHRTLGLTNHDLDGLPCTPILAGASAKPGYPADETPGFFVAAQASLDITVLADSSIGGVTVTNGGKYYRVAEYDGQPTGIKKAHVTNPGYGYAKVGRDAPTLTLRLPNADRIVGGVISLGTGSGLTMTPTLVERSDGCGLPYWTIESVSVSGGTNYAPSDPVFIDINAGSVAAEPAVLQLQTSGQEGHGEKPTLTPYAESGTGAVLEATLTPVGSVIGVEAWTISSVRIVDGGTGYSVNDYLLYQELPGYENADPNYILDFDKLAIVDVDQNGAIKEIGGYKGVPWYGGAYCKFVPRNTTVTGIAVKNGGKYYHENKSLPPYVSATANIVQLPPSAGSGASISVQVHDDPNDVTTFGCIKSLTVDNEGSGYTLLGGPMDCTYTGHCVSLTLQGPHEPLRISAAESSLVSANPLEDCGSLPSSATVQYGNGVASASITAGGTWHDCPTRGCGCDTNGCCRKQVTVPNQWGYFWCPVTADTERSDLAYIAATDSCDCEQQGGEWVVGRKCGCCCVDGELYNDAVYNGAPSPEILTPCRCAELGGNWIAGPCTSECACHTPDLRHCIVTVNGSTNVNWGCDSEPGFVRVNAYLPDGAAYPVVVSARAPITLENCEYHIGEFTVETEGDFEVSATCNPLP